jgi:transposase-like protein
MLNATQQAEAQHLAQSGLDHLEIANILRVAPLEILKTAYRNAISVRRADRVKPETNLKVRRDKIAGLAQMGKTVPEIAREVGCGRQTVRSTLRLMGLPIIHGNAGAPAVGLRNEVRAQTMASMFRQGVTLQKIGEQFGVTRERVRQILKTLGMTGEHGGASASSSVKKTSNAAAIKATRDARCFAKWGVPHADMKAGRADGTLGAYCRQKNSARHRGIEWDITFAQWLAVWRQSGRLELRGRGKGHYVMSRIKDDGGYRMGNVHIQLSTVNNSEGIKKCRSHKAANTGVWRLYPGSTRAWIAKVGRVLVGRYPTEAEAAAARKTYLRANPQAGSKGGSARGRGYSPVRNRRGKIKGYRAYLAGRHLGFYKTEALAAAARAAALLPIPEAA